MAMPHYFPYLEVCLFIYLIIYIYIIGSNHYIYLLSFFFSVNTPPIKCPFKGPYLFSYSKGINANECKDPLSEIDECTDDKRLLFKFKACADIHGSESRGNYYHCIPTI